MDLYNNNYGCSELPSGSYWEYSDILKQLEETYCACQSIEQIVPCISKFCTCQNWCFCASPVVQKLDRVRYVFLGENWEQINMGCFPRFCINLSLTFRYSQQEVVEDSSKSTKIDKKSQTSRKNMRSQFERFVIEKTENIGDSTKRIKKRRSRSSRLPIKSLLTKIRMEILCNKIPAFYSSPKKTRGTTDVTLGRRSRYIGVSKNNSHWQALISIRKTKKYIGTYISEQEAARIYDLYAIAIYGVNARINFDYTLQEMVSMIDAYLQDPESSEI
ncbi:unnamed protein product [Moneuplotes crassus]|uniref:AP2/ERF domain-containing protein n=1 Tax=Euplotes crassus TaxID=5936 RepID=A0AAD1XW71_EUPCR|nr:unnamed protein product [Moneuplotes crassus]